MVSRVFEVGRLAWVFLLVKYKGCSGSQGCSGC